MRRTRALLLILMLMLGAYLAWRRLRQQHPHEPELGLALQPAAAPALPVPPAEPAALPEVALAPAESDLAFESVPAEVHEEVLEEWMAPVEGFEAEIAEVIVAPESVASEAVAEPQDGEPAQEAVEGYCFRCRAKREIRDARIVTTEKGRRAASGVCPVCEGTIFRFLPSK